MGKSGKTKVKVLTKKPSKSAPKKKVTKSVKKMKVSKKSPVKKAPAKKVFDKKNTVKKTVKTVSKKAPAKIAKTVSPAPIKKVIAVKKGGNKTVVQKPNLDPLGMNNKVVPKQEATHLPPAFITEQKQKLMDLHDHLLDQMQATAQDNLRTRPEGSEGSAFGMHQADAGSDAYDKDFALSLLSQEQDALYEIEEALKRIENGGFGICEMSNKPIPKNRLEAIPFARFTVECQSQLEKENKGRRRWDTTPQFMDSEDSIADEDEETVDEEGNRKEKE